MYPEQDDEYREKWARLTIEVEMLILDIIHTAVERLNNRNPIESNPENQDEIEPF